MGLTGIEPVTSSLSGTRSNQLSYKPGFARKGRGTLRRETLVRFNIALKDLGAPLAPLSLATTRALAFAFLSSGY